MNEKYLMDYIPDKDLFKAIMFARRMIRDGEKPQIAITQAAKYYRKNPADVAFYVGQAGGRKRAKAAARSMQE